MSAHKTSVSRSLREIKTPGRALFIDIHQTVADAKLETRGRVRSEPRGRASREKKRRRDGGEKKVEKKGRWLEKLFAGMSGKANDFPVCDQ